VSFTEAEWLHLAQKKDEQAFSHLVETYQRPVYNLCYRMLGNAGDAEDAAQETFWRAFQAINRYDEQRSFITWLLSIAAHHCIDLQRKRRLPILDVDLLTDMDAADANPGPEKLLGTKQEQEHIERLLNKLKEQDRVLIVLRYWHELSEEEMARTLSISVPAIKSRLHRARKQLALLWKDIESELSTARSTHESPAF
jgi:RNA polymerase sigma-70 factor (ECF subfamily)